MQDHGVLSRTHNFGAARVLSKKKLQPERVLELVQKGLERLEAESTRPSNDLWGTKELIEEMKFYRMDRRLQALTFESRAYLQLGQTPKAQENLTRMNERLQEFKSLSGTKENRLKQYASLQASWWELSAQLAERKNHKLDAMAYYQTALLTRLQGDVKRLAWEKDELAEGARKLWNDLGGTAEGWNTWYERPATELAAKSQLTWEKANEPLPAFELADVQGKTWNLTGLKGKVVLLNFWSSW
jgi:hypothetical protein